MVEWFYMDRLHGYFCNALNVEDRCESGHPDSHLDYMNPLRIKIQ